jgi:hypothetical protein
MERGRGTDGNRLPRRWTTMMWDLPELVQLKKAFHALDDGRIDEALEIAVRPELRDHRRCQVLLERLVEPFLTRARSHLGQGRHEDALADVARAEGAGGPRSEVAETRQRIREAMEREKARVEERAGTIEAARRQLAEGALDEAELTLARLRDDASSKATNSGATNDRNLLDLERRIRELRESADETRRRLEEALDRDEFGAAIDATRRLETIDRRHPLIEKALRGITTGLSASLERGELARVARWADAARAIESPSEALAELLEVSRAMTEFASALRARASKEIGLLATRLERLLPRATWAHDAAEHARSIEASERSILGGPLGELLAGAAANATVASPQPGRARAAGALAPIVPGAAPGKRSPAPDPHAAARSKGFVLWVDGVGSYLVLTGENIGIGRAGSSARPDIPLSADIEGVHAQIVRVDGEHFLVARGAVTVRGSGVRKHLLHHRDECVLGARARFRFLLPSSLSSTAVLELGTQARVGGDVRHVILLDRHLIVGADSGAHIRVPKLDARSILSHDARGLTARSSETISIDGERHDPDAPLPFGRTIVVGTVSFTLTPVDREPDSP